jgi:hypothetical protein
MWWHIISFVFHSIAAKTTENTIFNKPFFSVKYCTMVWNAELEVASFLSSKSIHRQCGLARKVNLNTRVFSAENYRINIWDKKLPGHEVGYNYVVSFVEKFFRKCLVLPDLYQGIKVDKWHSLTMLSRFWVFLTTYLPRVNIWEGIICIP